MTPAIERRLDPRLTAARPDLAASSLRGLVEAERFVEGQSFTVAVETLDMRRRPRPDAPLETQLLHGETLQVYDEEDGWGWAQAERDGYVGYVGMAALRAPAAAPTHRVIVNRTFVYPAPDMKQPPLAALPLGARCAAGAVSGRFLRLADHGFVCDSHASPLDRPAPDFVAVAEQLTGVPYLWGGKTPSGIDCSGLVQLAIDVAGGHMPRDTDMQESCGPALAVSPDLAALVRGDLVFWRGHVGIMVDAVHLLHANAHHMLVAREPLVVARERIAADGSPITSIRRMPKFHNAAQFFVS